MFLEATGTVVNEDWTWAEAWSDLGPTLGRLWADFGSTLAHTNMGMGDLPAPKLTWVRVTSRTMASCTNLGRVTPSHAILILTWGGVTPMLVSDLC